VQPNRHPAPIGEFELIARYFARPQRPDVAGPQRPGRAVLGIGDDCALLAPPQGLWAVSTDMLVEGRHFFPEVDPQALGHKALAVNLSDLAAMGAQPVAFTLALALPSADERWLSGFSAGLLALADAHDCELVGGDTTRGPLNVCITVMGDVPPGQALRRDGARVGDDLWVSGRLGGAAWAVAHRTQTGGWSRPPALSARTFEDALERLHRPRPRVALGLALRGLAHAAIDLSDGLSGDLVHVLERSGQACSATLGALLYADALPLDPVLQGLPQEAALKYALAGGDDYELLFAVPPARRDAVQALAGRLQIPLTRIGEIQPRPGIHRIDASGRVEPLSWSAHDHFRS
jgi:thiamine-monophosphate kinase